MSAILDALTTAAHVLDTPGAAVRGAVWNSLYPEQSRNIFDMIGDPSQRIYGSDFTGNPWSGFGLDVAMDPFTLMMGYGLLSNMAKGAMAKRAMQKVMAEPSALIGRDSYETAKLLSHDLPTRHPMLKMPQAQAEKQILGGMPKDDFVFGPVRGQAPSLQYFDDTMEMMEKVPIPPDAQAAWQTVASRHPKIADQYRTMINQPIDASAAFQAGGTDSAFIRANKPLTPFDLEHEFVHAAQNKMGAFDDFYKGAMPREQAELLFEPTAWRRSRESAAAGHLFDYLSTLHPQRVAGAGLVGHNAMRGWR